MVCDNIQYLRHELKRLLTPPSRTSCTATWLALYMVAFGDWPLALLTGWSRKPAFMI